MTEAENGAVGDKEEGAKPKTVAVVPPPAPRETTTETTSATKKKEKRSWWTGRRSRSSDPETEKKATKAATKKKKKAAATTTTSDPPIIKRAAPVPAPAPAPSEEKKKKTKTKKKKSRFWLGWLIGGHFRRLRASASKGEQGMAMKDLAAPAAAVAPSAPAPQATEKKDPLKVEWGDESIASAPVPALVSIVNENYDPFRVDWGSRVSLHSVAKSAPQRVQVEVHRPPASISSDSETAISVSGNPFGDEWEREDDTICSAPVSASGGNPFGDDEGDAEEEEEPESHSRGDHKAKGIKCKLCFTRTA